MLPADLKPADFAAYPDLGKQIALQNLAVLRALPVSLAPLILREVIGYDWKFPAERKDLDRQFQFLTPLSPDSLTKAVTQFAALRIAPELQQMDWVNQPAIFAEQMSAQLWATHQIESFRNAAVDLLNAVNADLPEAPVLLRRVGIVVIGQGVSISSIPLFRKLLPFGTQYTNVDPQQGFETLLNAVRERAAAHPLPYGHWYIDGGQSSGAPCAGITSISYEAIRPLRTALQARMQKAWESGMGSEALRTMLAQLQPGEFGLQDNPVLDRFQVSLLSEGSGTQVYSTTFAQWAAREALRRAQPYTLLLRFAPRQRERAMNELLGEGRQTAPLDPDSSLRDADMGAYYTWLNLQRLTGSQNAAFLVWFENHREAMVIAPGTPRGQTSRQATTMQALLNLVVG